MDGHTHPVRVPRTAAMDSPLTSGLAVAAVVVVVMAVFLAAVARSTRSARSTPKSLERGEAVARRDRTEPVVERNPAPVVVQTSAPLAAPHSKDADELNIFDFLQNAGRSGAAITMESDVSL